MLEHNLILDHAPDLRTRGGDALYLDNCGWDAQMIMMFCGWDDKKELYEAMMGAFRELKSRFGHLPEYRKHFI